MAYDQQRADALRENKRLRAELRKLANGEVTCNVHVCAWASRVLKMRLPDHAGGDEQKGTPALDQQKWGYPNHPGVAGPCDFPDGSKWSGFEWTRPPRKHR